MDILLTILGCLWAIGGINEIARINAAIDSGRLVKPYKGIEFVMWPLLFLTWPYWYFYNKH